MKTHNFSQTEKRSRHERKRRAPGLYFKNIYYYGRYYSY